MNPAPSLTPTAESSCCRTTEDGSQVCAVPQNGAKGEASCGCASTVHTVHTVQTTAQPIALVENPLIHLESRPRVTTTGEKGKRKNLIRDLCDGVLFAIACIASPCCTPFIVPAALVLLAGTPLAAWMTHNLGWVYGGLTLLSVVSLIVVLRSRSRRGRPIFK